MRKRKIAILICVGVTALSLAGCAKMPQKEKNNEAESTAQESEQADGSSERSGSNLSIVNNEQDIDQETEQELAYPFVNKTDPDLLAYISGEKQDDIASLKFAEMETPIDKIGAIGQYVVLPGIMGQKLDNTDEIASLTAEDRLKQYTKYDSDGDKADPTDQWISIISNDTVFSVKDALAKMKPISERGKKITKYAEIYYKAVDGAFYKNSDTNYIETIPDELIDAYVTYYQNNKAAYAKKIGITEDYLRKTYALHKVTMDIALHDDGKKYMQDVMVAEYIIKTYGKEMADEDYQKAAYDYLALTGNPVRLENIPSDDFGRFQARALLRQIWAAEIVGQAYEKSTTHD